MSLLSVMEADDSTAREMRATAARKVIYLASRGASVMERTERAADDVATNAWTRRMTAATLWLDAAETAAFVGDFSEARALLARATALLLQLDLPVGVLLQRVFLADERDLRGLSDNVRARWLRGDASDSSLPGASLRTEQWAYLLLSDAITAGPQVDSGPLRGAPALSGQTPVGRMREPLDTYRYLSRLGDGSTNRTENEFAVVDEILRKVITRVLRAVEWSRANSYLWRRLLAPTPLFDFDTAALVGAALQITADLQPSLAERTAATTPPNDRRYLAEFLRAVRALRAASPSDRST